MLSFKSHLLETKSDLSRPGTIIKQVVMPDGFTLTPGQEVTVLKTVHFSGMPKMKTHIISTGKRKIPVLAKFVKLESGAQLVDRSKISSHEHHEADNTDSLNRYIHSNGGKIRLHIPGFHKEGESIEVHGARHHSGNQKADITLLDSNQNPIYWIDIKKVSNQGSIGEVDRNNEAVKAVTALFEKTKGKKNHTVSVDGTDKRNRRLIGTALFGKKFDKESHGMNNVSSLFIGDLKIVSPTKEGEPHTLISTNVAHHNNGGPLPNVNLRARTSRPEGPEGQSRKIGNFPGRLQITPITSDTK